MKSLAICLLVAFLFVATPLALDERVSGLDGLVPALPMATSAAEERGSSDLAIDRAPGTWWKAHRGPRTWWSLTLPKPMTLDGIQIDVGSYHVWVAPAEEIFLSIDGEPFDAITPAHDTWFGQWILFRFDPRRVKELRVMTTSPDPSPDAEWSLFDVRLHAPGRYWVDRAAFHASLPKLVLPFAAVLAWLLWLRGGRRR